MNETDLATDIAERIRNEAVSLVKCTSRRGQDGHYWQDMQAYVRRIRALLDVHQKAVDIVDLPARPRKEPAT